MASMAPGEAHAQDHEDVAAQLYRVIVQREPDPIGLDFYAGELRRGRPIGELIAIFLNSAEFNERKRREIIVELAAKRRTAEAKGKPDAKASEASDLFPADYVPPGEAGRSYQRRRASGFLDHYCSGPLVLDVGFSGYDNPERKAALPHAIGIDLDYPGYDGLTLPFADATVDTVFSSHCLEHIQFDHAAIRDWFRVLRIGGFIVCMVPSQALYEKRRFLPSSFNGDHKRMYTPATLARSFEEALAVNSYRVRHLAENDRGFNYAIGPGRHSDGAYEIELVIEKINPPAWELA